MVGSMDSIAMPNITLNAIVAEAFDEAANELEGSADFEKACDEYIAKTMREHQRIVFNGMVIRMNGLKKQQNVVFLTLNRW